MKRIFAVILVFVMSMSLIACKSDSKVDITITDINTEVKIVSFKVNVSDENNEITGNITVDLILKSSGNKVLSSTITKEELVDGYKEMNYSNLTAATEYTLRVSATIGRDTKTYDSVDFTTKVEDNTISTTEEFLAMSSNRYGNFELENDLDFTGVDFEVLFNSGANPFAGSFDGNGYTISNITIDSLSIYTGVFGYISTGRIFNVTFDNITIGTQENPLVATIDTRAGFLAGYITNALASIDEVNILNSQMHIETSGQYRAYVGGIVGDSSSQISNVSVLNSEISLKTTSYATVKLGGAVGFMNETATLKRVDIDLDLSYELAAANVKNRNLAFSIGGLVGDYNASSSNKAIENAYATSDIVATFDFGTIADTTSGNYTVNIGGIAGISYNNVSGAFYDGSITVNHEKNEFEEEVNKTIRVGGLFGFYGSSRSSDQVVRLGDGNQISVNVSDDVTYQVSQTTANKGSSATLNIGVYGEENLTVNMVSMLDSDNSGIVYLYENYFNNEFLDNAIDSIVDYQEIFLISSIKEFFGIITNRYGNFELENDLDFTGVDFEVLFNSGANPFAGSFDGNGYTISNITIDSLSIYTGVFGYISTGRIFNVTFDNITIGTQENPLVATIDTRAGFLAGYITNALASIDEVNILNSQMHIETSGQYRAYVGGIVGDSSSQISNVSVLNSEISLKTTSYATVKLGGAVGFMNETATLKRVDIDLDLSYELAAANVKNRNLAFSIGGLVGDYNASSSNKAIENAYATSDIVATFDFGTIADTTSGNYTVNIGGIAGISYNNVSGAFYDGSITVNHEKNEFEEEVNKTIRVGGLFGFYGSSRSSDQVVRLGDGNQISVNVSDDVTYQVSQTTANKGSSATLNIGVYGEENLTVNMVSMLDTDLSTVYDTLDGYFTNEWIRDEYLAYIA